MSYPGGIIKAITAGVLMVVTVSFAVYFVSRLIPANPAVYFLAWAFAAVPLALIITGWLAAQEAYFACLGHNKSTASAVGAALIAAIVGIALWFLIAPVLGAPEQMRLFTASLDRYGPLELIVILITYALAGAIGGIFHYFTLKGRKCEVKNNKQ
ncbi:hypothetical protein [Methanocella sp. MCL-LM]|uniref:hypothetical protein n=1 Tax=Methanocella sp. MCL-LM TaxID=3412035 RepID=UPI003C767E0D